MNLLAMGCSAVVNGGGGATDLTVTIGDFNNGSQFYGYYEGVYGSLAPTTVDGHTITGINSYYDSSDYDSYFDVEGDVTSLYSDVTVVIDSISYTYFSNSFDGTTTRFVVSSGASAIYSYFESNDNGNVIVSASFVDV